MKATVREQVLRYIRDLERLDGIRIVDAGGESEWVFDGNGERTGVNILFSCVFEPKRGKSAKGAC